MDSEGEDIKVRMEREYKSTEEPMFYLASLNTAEKERIRRFHTSESGSHQACGHLYKEIEAASDHVWKVLRQFDKPQIYKEFLVGCSMIEGDGTAGSIRHVRLQTGLPGIDSIEQLELLDEESKVLSFRILGGEHRLRNYISVTSVADRTLVNGRQGSLNYDHGAARAIPALESKFQISNLNIELLSKLICPRQKRVLNLGDNDNRIILCKDLCSELKASKNLDTKEVLEK
ncbi:hypothetical protein AXG93_3516s1000 [Marchantia polymorpha subsp. ruderalis]|uniref:Bet v I/Major latex protein domain-containing protein n=1 Tax=Marchantia polymorpha subsp. ruderalis TaxID=1480154 RepID=A0A176W074_MARPO|nr:hypothetical protein AXG93_3516s1000 [Marchantia polymorpha subsp. ruderalis]